MHLEMFTLYVQKVIRLLAITWNPLKISILQTDSKKSWYSSSSEMSFKWSMASWYSREEISRPSIFKESCSSLRSSWCICTASEAQGSTARATTCSRTRSKQPLWKPEDLLSMVISWPPGSCSDLFVLASASLFCSLGSSEYQRFLFIIDNSVV